MNRIRLARRVLLRAILVTGALLASVMAAVAVAASGTATLTTTVVTTTPEQAITVQLTFAGSASSGDDSDLYAVVRPASGPACGATFAADQAATPSEFVILDGMPPVPAGQSYSEPGSWTPGAIGSYVICAWLEQDPDTSNASTTVATPVTVAVRGPQVGTPGVQLSGQPTAGHLFGIAYTTQADQPLKLYSLVRVASLGACATSYQQDHTQIGHGTTLVNGATIPSGSATTDANGKLGAGSYVICSWVEGPAPDEVDAAVSSPFTVPAPPPTPKPPAPKAGSALAITSVSAGADSAISVSGTTAAGYLATLTITATCGKQKTKGAASASGGTWRASLGLPTGCAAGKTVIVVVQAPATAGYLAASAKNSVVVAMSSHPTSPSKPTRGGKKPSGPTLFSRVQRDQQAVTNVFRVRPTRILVASTTHLVLQVRWTRWGARGGRGHGTAITRHHGRYPVTVTTGHEVHGTYGCLTIDHRVRGRLRRLRLGLARQGHALEWVPLRTLDARHSTVTPYAKAGCPAPPS